MKNMIIATIVLLPCLAALHNGESIMPNIIGTAYTAVLIFLSRTETGKRFVRNIYRDYLRMERVFFNN